jgi:aryl-alcohol dehydrogenase-like predicted oxidoreductase
LGGNVFGWTVGEATAAEILDRFVGEGFDLIDTANVYPYWAPGRLGGESETLLGSWLEQRPKMRPRIFLATKVGFSKDSTSGGLSRRCLLREVDQSLRRLHTDYIDLYQSHVDDPSTPLEETLDTYASLIKTGKVRTIGASNISAERFGQALRVSATCGYPRYESLQPEYNLYTRAPFETALAPLCQTEQIGVIPYFALASGFLTGKYHSESEFLASRRGQFVQAAFNTREMFQRRGQRVLATLGTLSAEIHATPAQISLAWLLAHGVTAPIASVTSVAQLKELIGGARLSLSRESIALLDASSTSEN